MMVPTPTYETASGPCRDYTIDAVIAGNKDKIFGTACHQPDGSWQARNQKGIAMKHFLTTAGVVFALTATCVSCDKIKPPLPELQTPLTTSGQASQQEDERKAFAQAAQKELDKLRSVISELKARAESANLQTKARPGEEVEKLETELRESQQHLMALKSATVESWNQLKESFGKSLEKLKNGIDNFRKNAA